MKIIQIASILVGSVQSENFCDCVTENPASFHLSIITMICCENAMNPILFRNFQLISDQSFKLLSLKSPKRFDQMIFRLSSLLLLDKRNLNTVSYATNDASAELQRVLSTKQNSYRIVIYTDSVFVCVSTCMLNSVAFCDVCVLCMCSYAVFVQPSSA